MQIHIKGFLLILSSLLLVACTPQMTQDLWNGTHTYKDPLMKKRNAYYERETMPQKEKRKKNASYCNDLASSSINRVPHAGYPDGVTNKEVFKKCMAERGSPLFD